MNKKEIEKRINELNEALEQMIPVWEKTKTAELPKVLPSIEDVERLRKNLNEVIATHLFFKAYKLTRETMEKK